MFHYRIKTVIRTLILLLILPLTPFGATRSLDHTGLPVETGEIEIYGHIFTYEESYHFINIYDSRNRPVFQATADDPDIQILGFAYSRVLDSFVVFKQAINPAETTYTFFMEGHGFYTTILENVNYPVYNPILVEDSADDLTVLYITDEPALITYDIRRSQTVSHIIFDKPITRLKREKIHGREAVTFLKFDAGRSIPCYFNVNNVSTPIIRKWFLTDTDHEPPEQPEGQIYPSQIQLDEKTIVGFGDSITYGKIRGDKVPEKGYVPRLELLVNDRFYRDGGGLVINEGECAELTEDGAQRLEDVILTHRGRYLLFHEGTNDVIWPQFFTVAYVNANIRYMIETALKYGIQPIISTLIPRDPNHLTGKLYLRLRAIEMSNYIRTLSEELKIPLVDFWNIFSGYQELYGWYNEDSVMGDYVHPNEKGYQIMAEEWLKALQGEPMAVPSGIEAVETSPYRITIRWQANTESYFSHYILEFGYNPAQLSQTVTTQQNRYYFYSYPLHNPFLTRLCLRIQAVDDKGRKSAFSPLFSTSFH